jgi:hypothetical protein
VESDELISELPSAGTIGGVHVPQHSDVLRLPAVVADALSHRLIA